MCYTFVPVPRIVLLKKWRYPIVNIFRLICLKFEFSFLLLCHPPSLVCLFCPLVRGFTAGRCFGVCGSPLLCYSVVGQPLWGLVLYRGDFSSHLLVIVRSANLWYHIALHIFSEVIMFTWAPLEKLHSYSWLACIFALVNHNLSHSWRLLGSILGWSHNILGKTLPFR